ncbi:phosphoadenosine phosphosulfate reductase [Betaproteobacteria bacterium GR16-43]|nr:phosphoadenosine phosphosulfate reductase [Betaproteobacteria bacterium GR16-43]
MNLDDRVERARKLLAGIEKNYSSAALSSSFGAEDMVLLDLIARDGLAIEVFTLDTGRLPVETLTLIERVRHDYALDVQVYTPWPDSVEAYVAEHGADGFYDGVEQRKACCAVRKVEPLRRALASKRGWVSGLRRAQSDSRSEVVEAAYDPTFALWKFNPLADWNEDEVWAYLRANHVPYNKLHDRGYPSIGCEPCTRAVKPGEHPRAGRWWWEQDGAKKECGLHAIPIVLQKELA